MWVKQAKQQGKIDSILQAAFDEIQRMVRDAEVHAEEDKKTLELVNARNSLEALIHSVEKMLKDHGESLAAEERSAVESALRNAREHQKSDSVETLQAQSTALSEASHKLAEKMYSQASAAETAGAEAGASHSSAAGSGSGSTAAGGKDNVVDAEFEEVKDPGKA